MEEIGGVPYEYLFQLWVRARKQDKEASKEYHAYVVLFYGTPQWEDFFRWHMAKRGLGRRFLPEVYEENLRDP